MRTSGADSLGRCLRQREGHHNRVVVRVHKTGIDIPDGVNLDVICNKEPVDDKGHAVVAVRDVTVAAGRHEVRVFVIRAA